MCGILVISSSAPQDIIDHSISIIRQRGPDQLSSIDFDGYLFCHSRLIISGDSINGQQPIADERFIFLFNGEIYNTQYLSSIVNPTTTFTSDTFLLFEGFLRYGESFFNACDGPFAIVIYDKNTKQFSCFRDHLGEKPLFISSFATKKLISSDLRVFAMHKPVDKAALNEIVFQGYCSRSNTLFSDVKRIVPLSPSGEFYDAYLAFVRSTCFNSLKLTLSMITRNIIYSNSCVLLSGGVDSTLVCALLSDFEVVYPYTLSVATSKANDESRLAFQNAQKLNLSLSTLNVDDVYKFDHIITALSDMSEPIGDPGVFNQHMCIQLLKKSYKVVFVGTGADEIFAGYERYKFLFFISLISRLSSKFRTSIQHILFYFFKSSVLREKINKLLGFSNSSNIEEDRLSYLPNQLFASFDSISFINGMEARTPFTSIALRPFWVETNISHLISFIFLKYKLKLILLSYNINLFFKPKKGFTNDYSKLVKKPFFHIENNFDLPAHTDLQLVRLFIVEQWLKINNSYSQS